MMTGAATLVALGTIASLRCLADESRPNLAHIGEGVWLGYLVGLIYLFIELCTGQAIKSTIYNAIGVTAADLSHPEHFSWAAGQLVSVSVEDLTRNIAPATVFLWPGVFVVRGALRPLWAPIVSVLMVVLSGVVVFMSWHGTSKVAFLAGVAVFICARISPRLARGLLSAGWVTACVAIVPLALLAHRLDLHNATWLENSTRHRIIIWNFTAQEVFESPLLGIGARSTYTLGPRLEKSIENLPDEEFRRTLSKHSHNIFLQTWLELGLVGAVLLTLVGLSILGGISALEAAAQPYGFASFATAAAMAASSYGMWQAWFVAMFGLSALLFGVGRAALEAVSAREDAVERDNRLMPSWQCGAMCRRHAEPETGRPIQECARRRWGSVAQLCSE